MVMMYTLKGIFPEPKKEQKKNFIRENMKQLKLIQGKSSREPKLTVRLGSRDQSTGAVRSSPSSKSRGNLSKTSSHSRTKHPPLRIKKGDMAEFLKRKEQRNKSGNERDEEEDSNESSGRHRDIGCQTIETNLAQKLEESTKLTVLYPSPTPKKDKDDTGKASGDSGRTKGEEGEREAGERPRSRLNAILERKTDNKDPYLPAGYQKGVIPKYLRSRREVLQGGGEVPGAAGEGCPQGHVALPDAERKETLRMLRNSFAELVSELNKMPVKTDTLRMRSRKMELEKQLAKLEEGIKVFSRPKVFVKINE